MPEIKSESKLLLDLVLHILLTPIVFFQIIFGKKQFKDLFRPFHDIYLFLFDAKFTSFIVILTILISVFAWLFLPEEIFSLLLNYPQDLLDYTRWFSLISSGFIHANLIHLFGNMLALFIFGKVLERRIGTKKTIWIYLGAMLISSIGDSLIGLSLSSTGGSSGASGAIMGLVAAAILFEPLYITYQLLIPLPIMVVGWLSIYADFSGILNPSGDGVARFAHAFGYLSILMIMFFFSGEEKSKLKKGFYINLISLGIFGLIYFLFL